jgi:putative ABC transport system permease protein
MYWPAQDLRYGIRILRRTFGATSVAIGAMALGIGASVALFGIVDAVLLKPLPFRDPGRLLVIWENDVAQHQSKMYAAGANFLAWQQRSHTLESVAAIQDWHLNLTGGPDGAIDPEELKAESVSAGLFPLLGVQPVMGRAFRPEEDQPGRTGEVVISYDLWQRRFGADPAICGRSIRLRDSVHTVIGVLPPGFSVIEPRVDVWLPLALNAADSGFASRRNLVVIARLRPGVTLAQARAELLAIGDSMAASNPVLDRGWLPSPYPIMEELTGDFRKPLLVLLAAVGLLLLIACANVANLLLARGVARRREVAIRTAMGASRGRIVRQLLSESVLLSLAGGALGILLAAGAITLVARLGPSTIPRLASAHIDPWLLLFALALSVGTGVLFGMAPALQISGTNVNAALVEGGRSGMLSRSGRLLRDSLVVSEIAVALVLLIGAGLLVRSFVRLRTASPGFDPEHLLTFRVPLAGGRNSAVPRRIAFFHEVTDRLAALPGVRSVGAVISLPLTGLGLGAMFAPEDRPMPPEERPIALARPVVPGYFHAMGIPLRAGRDFNDSDTQQSTPVAIVNETIARRFWPDSNPLGYRLQLFYGTPVAAEIVGVVGDVKSEALMKDDWPTVYQPYPQAPATGMSIVIRTAGPPLSLASAAAREIHQLDPEQPVAEMRTMRSVVAGAEADARFHTTVLATFAGISFVLAAMGIYGVITYQVGERTHEIGIRVALGAQRGDLFRLVMSHTARLAGIGIGLGLVAAWALTRLLASMLYQVSPRDFYTYAAISLMLGMVALLAGYFPSRRAMALDPLAALRHE